jgi:hypothetical protein
VYNNSSLGGNMKITFETNPANGIALTLDEELTKCNQDEFIDFLENFKMQLQIHIDDANNANELIK